MKISKLFGIKSSLFRLTKKKFSIDLECTEDSSSISRNRSESDLLMDKNVLESAMNKWTIVKMNCKNYISCHNKLAIELP